MLSHLVSLVLRRPAVVVILGLIVAFYGLHVAGHSKFDLFPEFIPTTVTVQVECPGLPPGDVETRVTSPLEHALGGTPGVVLLTSDSGQGLSVVKATYRDGMPMAEARQQVAERLVGLSLPPGVHTPAMSPPTSSSEVGMIIGLVPHGGDPALIREVATWTVKQRLLAVPGVANVTVFGGHDRRMEVRVDPARLMAHGMSLDEVSTGLGGSLGTVAGSTVDVSGQRMVIETPPPPATVDAIRQLVLRGGPGQSVCVADVADVVVGPAPAYGGGSVMGKPGIVMEVVLQRGANTLDVTQRVDQALSEIKPALDAQGYQLHSDLFRPANFIQLAVRNAGLSLAIGGVLVVLIILAFLADLRSAVITLTAIPLSLLMAVIVLDRMGLTLNTITLGGLAIAIGEVVDDAIIDVENILRRLRENRHLAAPKPVMQVIHAASLEVRGSVVYATFVVVLVFVPVFMMGGTAGRLLGPLAVAYVSAILASLAVALTVTPAMAALLLKPDRIRAHEPRPVEWLKNRYARILGGFLRHPRTVLGVSAVVCAASLLSLKALQPAFIPELQEGHLIAHMMVLPGTDADETLRLGSKVTELLLEDKRIRKVCHRVGRAEQGEDTVGTNNSEFDLDLNPMSEEEGEALRSDLRERLAKVPGATFGIVSFLRERIEETTTASAAPVSVKVHGNDLAELDQVADQVVAVLESIPGSVDVARSTPGGLQTVRVKLKPDGLRLHGFTPAQVQTAVQMACDGLPVADLHDGKVPLGLVLKVDRGLQPAPETLPNVMLRSADGHRVALGELVALERADGRLSIPHQEGQRMQEVTAALTENLAKVKGAEGLTPAGLIAMAKTRIAREVPLPPGVYLSYACAADAADAARADLLMGSLIAGAGILLLLWIVYCSARNLALVLVNVPFALAGGLIAVLIGGGLLSVGAMVGFVTLLGISTRNTIMLVSHYEQLVREEGHAWDAATALRGARERVTPVLMTAIVTALGLLPVALSTGKAGGEIEGPMAIVILGGLVSSTALTLLVLPVLALRFGRFKV